jgi:hypothetical protein
VREHDRGLARGTRIAVGDVRGDLLMARVDEFHRAVLELGEHRDIGVAAQAEDVLHAAIGEVLDELLGDELFHDGSCLVLGIQGWGEVLVLCGTARGGAPV